MYTTSCAAVCSLGPLWDEEPWKRVELNLCAYRTPYRFSIDGTELSGDGRGCYPTSYQAGLPYIWNILYVAGILQSEALSGWEKNVLENSLLAIYLKNSWVFGLSIPCLPFPSHLEKWDEISHTIFTCYSTEFLNAGCCPSQTIQGNKKHRKHFRTGFMD